MDAQTRQSAPFPDAAPRLADGAAACVAATRCSPRVAWSSAVRRTGWRHTGTCSRAQRGLPPAWGARLAWPVCRRRCSGPSHCCARPGLPRRFDRAPAGSHLGLPAAAFPIGCSNLAARTTHCLTKLITCKQDTAFWGRDAAFLAPPPVEDAWRIVQGVPRVGGQRQRRQRQVVCAQSNRGLPRGRAGADALTVHIIYISVSTAAASGAWPARRPVRGEPRRARGAPGGRAPSGGAARRRAWCRGRPHGA
jgi:hypothetical protein